MKREWRDKDENVGGECELPGQEKRDHCFFPALEILAVNAASRCCDL